MFTQPKILFICKQKHIYSSTKHDNPISSGLYNSARFVVDMLNENGVEAKLVDVIDNNCIDREVTNFKPTHVIIEALWVVPEKFRILQKLHPNVKWIIRLHSELPFLSNEGIAIEWIYKYLNYKNVFISSNSEKMTKELSELIGSKVIYLPNYYPLTCTKKLKINKDYIDIGCFGAIRPLKNQLIQAVAAIEYGNKINKEIRFHINGNRIEGKGDPILKNIRYLFLNNPKHKLIEHDWMNHEDFIEVIKKMDIGMQVSYSETFNIVTADFVNNNIPVVVSDEISWIANIFKADPNSVNSIIKKLDFTLTYGNWLIFKDKNRANLNKYNLESEEIWINLFKP